MIVLSGPSASGKTKIAQILEKKYGIVKVITTTTRNMRDGERHGVDYFFLSKEEFLNKVNNGDFVEYMEYNGNYYGSTKDQVQDNKCIVTDLNGLKSYCKLKDKGAVTFFIKTNEKTRYERMISRGDGENKASERIKEDKTCFKNFHLGCINFIIDNNEEKRSLEEIADEIYQKYINFRK